MTHKEHIFINCMFLFSSSFKKTTTNFLFKLSKHQTHTNGNVFNACCWGLKADESVSKIIFKREQTLSVEVKEIPYVDL